MEAVGLDLLDEIGVGGRGGGGMRGATDQQHIALNLGGLAAAGRDPEAAGLGRHRRDEPGAGGRGVSLQGGGVEAAHASLPPKSSPCS